MYLETLCGLSWGITYGVLFLKGDLINHWLFLSGINWLKSSSNKICQVPKFCQWKLAGVSSALSVSMLVRVWLEFVLFRLLVYVVLSVSVTAVSSSPKSTLQVINPLLTSTFCIAVAVESEIGGLWTCTHFCMLFFFHSWLKLKTIFFFLLGPIWWFMSVMKAKTVSTDGGISMWCIVNCKRRDKTPVRLPGASEFLCQVSLTTCPLGK